MSFRRQEHEGPEGAGERGFTGFLRSLLSGIPWSERAEREETHTVEAPPGGGLRIHNPNGRTRVTGGDRRDIEVKAFKTARAARTTTCTPAISSNSWTAEKPRKAVNTE